MTEILTESFCERCGTRYTFETARPSNSRLSRARTLTKGIRNFVLSDDPFSVAMADARGEEELAATVVQLDAFHKTFNFCMSCRQYTCGNCWNTDEGRCLSCAPLPDTEPLEDASAAAIAERLAAIAPAPPVPEGLPDAETIGISAWPAVDLPRPEPSEPVAPTNGGVEVAEAVAPAVEAPLETAEPMPAEVLDQATAAPDQEVVGPADAAPPSPLTAEAEPADAVRPAVHGLMPGEDLEHAIAAYEASLTVEELEAAPVVEPSAQAVTAPELPAASDAGSAELESAVEPEPVAMTEPAVEAEPAALAEPAVEAEPAALAGAALLAAAAAEPVTEPEAVETVVAPAAEPVADTQPETVAARPEVAAPEPPAPPAPPVAVVAPAPVVPPLPTPEPPAAAPIAASAAPAAPEPASPASMAPGWLTVAPDDGAAPSWPQRPAWPSTSRRGEATLAGRRMMPTDNAASLWAASAREVLEAGPTMGQGVAAPAASATAQPCVGCGLPLSANARFCRRCGTRQG